MTFVRYLGGGSGLFACACVAAFGFGISVQAGPLLPPTANDVKAPGTQPIGSGAPASTMLSEPIVNADSCFLCHLGMDSAATTIKPYRWRGSMHSHAYRDPIFQAAYALLLQDAPAAGQFCLRCHTPGAWLSGRASPPTGSPDGSTLTAADRDNGITCNACHRLVDLDAVPTGPPDDTLIRDALQVNGLLPPGYGNVQMVVDPMDVRRGPLDFITNMEPEAPHLWLYSPHHRTGDLCGTCHDVSNPLFDRNGGPTPAPGDTYTLNAPDTQHPTHNKHDQFPEQRTYSEWKNSAFATTPGGLFIPDETNPMVNRFGGNRTMVSQCQDCHMPATTGQACWEIFESPVRNDLPSHTFVGANVFALDAIVHLHGPTGTNELDATTLTLISRQRADTLGMLAKATDMGVSQIAGEMTSRVTNQTGHKLLTGMPEGRRIWTNVRFYNGPTLIAERGAYDTATGVLSESDTKVYEQLLGIDAYMAAQTGQPAGHSFHLAFVNTVLKDNRIPPRGYARAAFEAVQAGHVNYAYPDGQHWDDTRFCIPPGATRAEVTLYYQTSSKEYVEFLRDATAPDPRGLDLYDAWVAVGRANPIVMDQLTVVLAPFAVGDVTNDGMTTFGDITTILANFGAVGGGILSGDANCDGVVSFADITVVLANFGDTA